MGKVVAKLEMMGARFLRVRSGGRTTQFSLFLRVIGRDSICADLAFTLSFLLCMVNIGGRDTNESEFNATSL